MLSELDRNDRLLLNRIQSGFPIASRPFLEIGEMLGMSEEEVIARVRHLLETGVVNRLGPVLSPTAVGGERTLATMSVPPERLEEVAALVNSFEAVSHNYEREHHYNLWFVLSSEEPGEVERALAAIERETGIAVMNLPALEEYFLGVRFQLPTG
jgi:DNA-binding Lrp family transcriptional regulator